MRSRRIFLVHGYNAPNFAVLEILYSSILCRKLHMCVNTRTSYLLTKLLIYTIPFNHSVKVLVIDILLKIDFPKH